ncbi:MAG: hypothetical protein AAF488_14815 [Planctomycetota bacterium]
MSASSESALAPSFEQPIDGAREEAGRRGVKMSFDAIGLTVVEILSQPSQTFAAFRWAGGLGPATIFVWILAAPCLALGFALDEALVSGSLREVSPSFFGGLLLAPPIYVFLRAHMVHVVLVLQGVAARSFEATYRTVAYTTGAAALLCLLLFGISRPGRPRLGFPGRGDD